MHQYPYFGKGNLKLSSEIITFSLPSHKTCPGKGLCAKYCYSLKRERSFPNILKSRYANLEATRKKTFIKKSVSLLTKRKESIIRIHPDGDFYDQKYLDKWKEIAVQLPHKTFYCYTKSFMLDFSDLPSNMKVIQSFGSYDDSKIDISKNTARVIEDKSELKKGELLCQYSHKHKIKCGKDCSYCIKSPIVHVAFIRH